jgi:hypothetical protein
VSLPFRDALEHTGEHWTARRSCPSSFEEDVHDGEALRLCKSQEFAMLGFERKSLMIVVFRGFPAIDEVLVHVYFII